MNPKPASPAAHRFEPRTLILVPLGCVVLSAYWFAQAQHAKYRKATEDVSTLREEMARVMPEAGRFYGVMVMMMGAARTNATAAELVRRHNAGFLTVEEAREQTRPLPGH